MCQPFYPESLLVTQRTLRRVNVSPGRPLWRNPLEPCATSRTRRWPPGTSSAHAGRGPRAHRGSYPIWGIALDPVTDMNTTRLSYLPRSGLCERSETAMTVRRRCLPSRVRASLLTSLEIRRERAACPQSALPSALSPAERLALPKTFGCWRFGALALRDQHADGRLDPVHSAAEVHESWRAADGPSDVAAQLRDQRHHASQRGGLAGLLGVVAAQSIQQQRTMGSVKKSVSGS